ncbi:DGQHR domain-containing protein [Deinococcus caeni]|uniref:DGQHR domain-containing protein n=1 Tax=Deinococcus caeni TaxID=569127 RepID=A0ABP9UDI0_9DEIO
MLEVKAQRVQQPFGEFYLATIKAQDLIGMVYVDRFRAMINENNPAYYDIEGVQRRYSRARQKLIASYVRSDQAALPGTIILSANTPILSHNHIKINGQDAPIEGNRWSASEINGEIYINIPNNPIPASIIDGQHRVYGIMSAISEIESKPGLYDDDLLESLKNTDLPCSIYFDLPPELQAYIFATINFNQKSVDKSLAYELFNVSLEEERSTWSPDKLAIWISRRLNSKSDPTIDNYNRKVGATYNNHPLKGRIKIASQVLIDSEPQGEKNWKISTATFVNGIMSLYSNSPQRDRYAMYDKITSGNRLSLSPDGPPLRQQYRFSQDESIYLAVSHYFAVLDEIVWSKVNKGSFLVKTVGIMASFALLKRIFERDLAKDQDISMDYFVRILEPLRKINFSLVDDLGEASGTGRTQILNLFLYAMGMAKTEEDFIGKLPPYADNHIAFYSKYIKDLGDSV